MQASGSHQGSLRSAIAPFGSRGQASKHLLCKTGRRNRQLVGAPQPNQLALLRFLQGEAMSDYLVIGGWSGRRKIPVQILGETPEGFWIKPQERAMLPGRGLIKRGQRVHVPRTVIKLDTGERLAAQPQRKSLFLTIQALRSKAVKVLRHLQPA